MRYLRFMFIIILAGFGISFACLNAEQVRINYYFGERQLLLPLLLALTLLVGALLGFLVSLPSLLRSSAQLRRLRKRASVAEQEVSNLRSIPILDESRTYDKR